MNNAATRSYAFTYTQNVADIYQYNTVTIPGCVDGVWEKANLVGMNVIFSLGCGTTYTAPTANIWLNVQYSAGPGQINAVAATSDTFRITGVIVLPGTEAPSAARSPLIMRPYPQELDICKRYWRLITPDTRFDARNASSILEWSYPLSPEMRVSPTVTTFAVGTAGNLFSFTPTPLSGKEVRPTLVSVAAGDSFINSTVYSLDARL